MSPPLTQGRNTNQNCIRKTILSIIQSEGVTILDNPKRVRALLSDYCAGEYKREIVLLERLLDEKIHLELIRQKKSLSYDMLSVNLTNRILVNHPFDKDLVESCIDNLALALEIIKIVPERNPPSIKPTLVTRKARGGKHDGSPNQSGLSENDPLIIEALNLNRSKSFDEALRLLDRILTIDSGNSVALREKAYAISNLGHYRDSLHWFNESLRINPADPVTWIQKGYALSKIGKNQDAVYCYDAAIKLDPDGAVVWRNRGFSLRKLKDYPAALQSYENALRINPQDHIAWKLKGGALGLMKRYSEAFHATKQALALNPDYDEAMMNMGWLLSDQGHYEDAISWYDKALQIDQDNQRAWKQRGYCLKKLNSPEKGKKPHPIKTQSLQKKAPTPENQGIMDRIKGFFK